MVQGNQHHYCLTSDCYTFILAHAFMEQSLIKERNYCVVKDTFPITSSGGSQCCEASILQHFLDIRLKDDCEAVIYAPAVLPRQEYSWYSFLLEIESIPGA
jgi:hypothetical protein